MAFSTAGGSAPKPEINVTPLIDVLLTLIVVFMLVVSAQKDYQEKAQIPQPHEKRTDATEPPRTVVVQLSWSHDSRALLKINGADVSWHDLESSLARIYVQRMEKVVFVRGDGDVEFQDVADAIDIAHHAGVSSVGLLSKDPEAHAE